MTYSNNVYYSPENFGLKVVAVGDAGESYDFSLFVVWRDKDGGLLWAYDAGCSCPEPFEDVRVADLTRGNRQEALTALQRWASGQYVLPDVTHAVELLMQEA